MMPVLLTELKSKEDWEGDLICEDNDVSENTNGYCWEKRDNDRGIYVVDYI